MRTIVYIDGYNLYYGCLKHSEYKWLDLVKLFEDHILKAQAPNASLDQIKFFTAPTLGKFSSHGRESEQFQQRYHRALTQLYPETVDITRGYFSSAKAHLPVFKQPVDPKDRTPVWRLEEKETDVNIALSIYRDCSKGIVDQVIVVSNDSDLVPVLAAIKDDFGDRIQRGVVLPLTQPTDGDARRPGNTGLSLLSHWTRHHIRNDELQQSQLPAKIPTNKKAILKPERW